MTNKYIPIKDAINILEDRKLDLVIDDNDFPYNDPDPSSESLDTIPVREIHALNIIKLVEKRYHRSDGSVAHGSQYNALYLYGKKSYNESMFEKVYMDLLVVDTHDFATDRIITQIDHNYSKYSCDLFENYNYTNRYDPNINYTVLGHKRSDTIQYYDISLDYAEFMEFLDRTFKGKSNDK